MRYAKVNLEQTTVYAQSNGRIQNMFLSLGTPIEINKPIFSLLILRVFIFKPILLSWIYVW